MSDGNEKLYDFKARSDESALECKDPSRTVQADLIDSDINVIVARFNVTGMAPQGMRIPEFADYEDVFDFQSAQNALIAAEQHFMALPAKVRAEFDNSPQEFLEFCSREENLPRMRELGLAIPEVVVDTVPVVVDTVPVVDNPKE